MTPVEVNDTRITEWRNTGYPCKVIAAEIAEWALKQDRGTLLPGNDLFAGDLGIVASATTWKRARVFLAAVGVLCRNDGPYLVSLGFPRCCFPSTG
jgi:hypothetical protein